MAANSSTRYQEANLTYYRARWEDLGRSTISADRSATERAIDFAYRVAGLRPPEKIVWCDSPVDVERRRKATWHLEDPGPLVTQAVVHDVLAEGWNSAVRGSLAYIRAQIGNGLGPDNRGHDQMGLQAALDASANAVGWTVGSRLSRIKSRFGSRRSTKPTSFSASRWFPQDCYRQFAMASCFESSGGGRPPELEAFSGLSVVAAHTSVMVPHARICWVADRPEIIRVDQLGRLHSGDGPAVRYRDGWSLYAWKGLVVPKRLIEQRNSVTPRQIDQERDPIQRRCMIELLTPETYVGRGRVARKGIDPHGSLWLKEWPNGDRWAAVEVVNGTPESDGTYKRYFLQVPPELRTPTEAVAWTYGLSPDRYAALQRRT